MHIEKRKNVNYNKKNVFGREAVESEKIKKSNLKILAETAKYIAEYPDFITEELVRETAERCGIDREEAFRVIASGVLGVYDNGFIMRNYVSNMFVRLDAAKYENDLYMKTVKTRGFCGKAWKLTEKSYRPYEAFVYNDLKKLPDGRLIPQIGYFDREFAFPCVTENGREWMTVTPNEIETMKKPIERARGNVLTYGLGLGYFAFMAAAKDEVDSVTVVEKEREITELFSERLLPQFINPGKIKIICGDALEFAAKKPKYDFVFADIWHDPSDAMEPYLLLRAMERDDVEYAYWIEDTIKCYLR